jgi:hypothetical protein
MTDHPKNGGPAFPQASDHPYADNGMSLRDWFAGQALAWVTSMPANAVGFDVVAAAAYKLADAMLAARESKE